jgi:hypothetical protein
MLFPQKKAAKKTKEKLAAGEALVASIERRLHHSLNGRPGLLSQR